MNKTVREKLAARARSKKNQLAAVRAKRYEPVLRFHFHDQARNWVAQGETWSLAWDANGNPAPAKFCGAPARCAECPPATCLPVSLLSGELVNGDNEESSSKSRRDAANRVGKSNYQ